MHMCLTLSIQCGVSFVTMCLGLGSQGNISKNIHSVYLGNLGCGDIMNDRLQVSEGSYWC